MKLWWNLTVVALALSIIASTVSAEADSGEEDKEILVRTARGAKDRASGGNGSSGNTGNNGGSCRYIKGQWSDCDSKTNSRTRTLSLKKGDKSCEQTKTITKKCKKACRYEKGTWSDCANQLMTRIDNLKTNSDTTCEPTRRITKRCKTVENTKKSQKGDRPNKKQNKQ